MKAWFEDLDIGQEFLSAGMKFVKVSENNAIRLDGGLTRWYRMSREQNVVSI